MTGHHGRLTAHTLHELAADLHRLVEAHADTYGPSMGVPAAAAALVARETAGILAAPGISGRRVRATDAAARCLIVAVDPNRDRHPSHVIVEVRCAARAIAQACVALLDGRDDGGALLRARLQVDEAARLAAAAERAADAVEAGPAPFVGTPVERVELVTGDGVRRPAGGGS